MHGTFEETQSRRTLREVVALSALPSIWAGHQPHEVAESLAEVLLNTLPLEFVYFRLRGEAGGRDSEVVHTGRPATVHDRAREISQALAPWLTSGDTTLPHTLPNPTGDGMVRLLRVPIGQGGGEDDLVVGSRQVGFPNENDRLLLGVGANQAGIVLRHWRAEQRLRESEVRGAEAQRLAGVGSWDWDIVNDHVTWSDGHYHIFGLEPQSARMTYKQVLARVHPEDRSCVRNRIAEACQDHKPFECTLRVLRPDQSIRVIRSLGEVMYDPDDKPVRMTGSIQDITEQHATAQLIQEGDERFRAICDQAIVGIAQVDLNGRFAFVNERYLQMLGHTYSKLMRMQMQDVTHPDDRPANLAQFRLLAAGGPDFSTENRYLRKDGSPIWVRCHVNGIRDPSGNVTSIVAVSVDVTEQRQHDQALRNYANLLRELSRRVVDAQEKERRHLARELHDEIGQVLNTVSVNLYSLNRTLDVAGQQRVEESIRIVDQASRQVHDLSLDLRPAMLDDLGLVTTLRWFARRQAQRAGLKLEFVADSSGECLPADLAIASYRVVQEALTNVVRHAQASHVWVEYQQGEDEVRMVVRDDGIGFDLGAVRQSAAQGASFGVLGMEERVEILGGQIEFASSPGQGTAVEVRFPLSSEAIPRTELAAR